MNKKNDAQVVINGKTYSISGYENVEYLQRIATYLNQKSSELKSQLGHNIINDSEKNVLMQINLADDYLKLKMKQEENSAESQEKQKEIASLKREIVALQTKLETAETEGKLLRSENIELQKKNVKLETQLTNLKNKQ